jgi:hypothetical protein
MAYLVANLATHNAQLGHYGLLVGLVKILPEGLAEWLFPISEGLLQTP